MYYGSIEHSKIISAFQHHVPGVFVRDYRDNNGYIAICRGYKDIKWGGQTTTTKVYRTVPHETLVNLPRGNVASASTFRGMALVRPGWRIEFRKAARLISEQQQRRITKELHVGEVFRGIT